MKTLVILIAVVIIAALSLGGGFYLYQRTNHPSQSTETSPSSVAVDVPTLAPLVVTPVATSMNPSAPTVTPSSSPVAGGKSAVAPTVTVLTPKNGSSSKMTLVMISSNEPTATATTATTVVQGADYVAAYNAVIARYNVVATAQQAVQKTVAGVTSQYKASGASGINDLVLTGETQNTKLQNANKDFRAAVDAFSALNKKVANTAIRTKGEPLITTGIAFSESMITYSDAAGNLLAYRGTGDLTQLGVAFQGAAQSVGQTGPAFTKELLAFKTYLSQWQK